jgi:hypothetical protein
VLKERRYDRLGQSGSSNFTLRYSFGLNPPVFASHASRILEFPTNTRNTRTFLLVRSSFGTNRTSMVSVRIIPAVFRRRECSDHCHRLHLLGSTQPAEYKYSSDGRARLFLPNVVLNSLHWDFQRPCDALPAGP